MRRHRLRHSIASGNCYETPIFDMGSKVLEHDRIAELSKSEVFGVRLSSEIDVAPEVNDIGAGIGVCDPVLVLRQEESDLILVAGLDLDPRQAERPVLDVVSQCVIISGHPADRRRCRPLAEQVIAVGLASRADRLFGTIVGRREWNQAPRRIEVGVQSAGDHDNGGAHSTRPGT